MKPYKSAEAELDLEKALEISQAMETATRQTVELQGATPVDSTHAWWHKQDHH